MRLRALLCASFAIAALPCIAAAQDSHVSQCAQNFGSILPRRGDCERLSNTVHIIAPRLGIAASGGNPLPGTASTLGMRLGSFPRISAGLRATSAFVSIPAFDNTNDNGQSFAASSFDIDASAGVFSGISILPTIGGFASVDVLASAGITSLPRGKGFNGSPKTWAVGGRLGILRESFTAPGISLSAMYRHVGDLSYGDSTFQSRDAYFALDHMHAWSYRAAISKRLPIIGLGATAGVGVDRYTASSEIRIASQNILLNYYHANESGTKSTRKSAFIDASWTMLLLNLTGELGWQEGGHADAAASVPATKLENAGYFASLAARITL